jgi:hypothetical protein
MLSGHESFGDGALQSSTASIESNVSANLNKGHIMGGKPAKAPAAPAPTPPPSTSSTDVASANREAKRSASMRKGWASTILSQMGGVDNVRNKAFGQQLGGGKTLLGQ